MAPQKRSMPSAGKPAAPKRIKLNDVSDVNKSPSPLVHSDAQLQAFGWGVADDGQLGMGPDHLGEYSHPKLLEGVLDSMKLEAIVAGGMFSLWLDSDGKVWSSGANDDAALGRVTEGVLNPATGSFFDEEELSTVPRPIEIPDFRAIKVVAGDSVAAAIGSDGGLRVWGSFRDLDGHLGFSGNAPRQFTPTSVLAPIKDKVVSAAAGTNHLLIMTSHGHIYSLGAGSLGQLGRKVIQRRKLHGTKAERVILGRRSKAVVVGAGAYHSFAVDTFGQVWGWGLNSYGQTGTSSAPSDVVQLPTLVLGLSKDDLRGDTVIAIAGGEHHTLFLTAWGKVYSCGRSDGGQLGLSDNHRAEAHVAIPALVALPFTEDTVVQVAAGIHTSMAVTQSGVLYVWGAGEQSELGAGQATQLDRPTVIPGQAKSNWKAVSVSCGGQHTLALFQSTV